MAVGSAEQVRIIDFADMQRAREENYRALHMNARFIPYLPTVAIVFVFYNKLRAFWRKPFSPENENYCE